MNSCAPANDGQGTALCLLLEVHTLPCTPHPTCTIPNSINWHVALSGVGFYPPSNEPLGNPSVTPFQTGSDSMVIMGVSDPGVGFPGCTNVNQFQVICAVHVNFQLQGIRIDSSTRTMTGMAPLPFVVNGDPICTSGGNGAAICAASQGELIGFAFDLNGVASLMHLGGAGLFRPSCAAPADGTNVAICATSNGSRLFGIAFDPRTGFHTAFQDLGTAPDTGNWLGEVGCSASNDTTAKNKVTCAAISSSGNVYAVKFDPRVVGAPVIRGPFFSGASADLSCITLAVDANQITCGVIRSGGGSSGFDVPFPPGL